MLSTKSVPLPLQATLSGDPHFRWGEQDLRIEAKKPLALLCILSISETGWEREELAQLLWGPGRLLNVRQALYQLRQLPGADEWLDAGELVSVLVECDVRAFEAAMSEERFADALELWRPPLLGKGLLPNESAFVEWLEVERSRLDRLYARALEGRTLELERGGDFAGALALVDRSLELDPLRENGYRAAMRLSYLLGDQESAINYFRRCTRVLREEFDSDPLPSTVALANTIAAGETLPVRVAAATLPENLAWLLRFVVIGRGRLSTAELAASLQWHEFEVARGLEELEQRKLLQAGGTVPAHTLEEVRGVIAPAPVRLAAQRLASSLGDQEDYDRELLLAELWLLALEPGRAAPLYLRALERAFREELREQIPELAYRVLWTGTPKQRFEAALILEEVAQSGGDEELQGALLDLAGEVAWDLQDDELLIRAKLRRARQQLRAGNPAGARELGESALENARRIGSELLQAQANATLGVTHFSQGDLPGARRYFEANRESSLDDEKFRALNNLGAVAGLQGDLEGSYGFLEEALTLARRRRRVQDVSACLNNLAATAERLAAYDHAIRRIREGRDLARRAGNVNMSTQLLLNLAQVFYRQGSLGPAWNTTCEALDEALQQDDMRLTGQAYEQLAQISRFAGAWEEAARNLELALSSYEGTGDARKLASANCALRLLEYVRSPRSGSNEARESIEQLSALGAEIGRWCWAELALLEQDPELAMKWAGKVTEGGENRHLAFLAQLARLRTLLLQGAVPEVPAPLLQDLDSLRVVEAPIAHLIAAACTAGPAGESHQRKARELLEEQASGLPRSLRDTHLSLAEDPQVYLPRLELDQRH